MFALVIAGMLVAIVEGVSYVGMWALIPLAIFVVGAVVCAREDYQREKYRRYD